MGARCRRRQKVGRVTPSYALHPEMVGRGRAKKDDAIKFIIDKLELKRYKQRRHGTNRRDRLDDVRRDGDGRLPTRCRHTVEKDKMKSKTKKEWVDIITERANRRVRYAVEIMRCWMYPDQQATDADRDLAAWGREHGITPAFIKSVFFGNGGMIEGEMPHVKLDYLEANPDDMAPWMEFLDDLCSDGEVYWTLAFYELLTKEDWDASTLEEFVHMTETRYFREANKLYKDRMLDVLAEYGEVDPEMGMHKQVCDWLARQLDSADFSDIVAVYELDAGWEAGEDERFEDEDAYNNAMFDRATEWVEDCLMGGRGNAVFGTWDECATVLIKYCSDAQVRYVWDVLEMEQYEWL